MAFNVSTEISGEIFAVLTGDVIKSSKLSPHVRRQALSYLNETAVRLPQVFSNLTVIGPEIFRGDSWQMLLSDARLGLHAAFYLRAELRSRFGVDTRIGIGVGGLETLSDQSVGSADGPAFRRSGKALDSLKRNETMLCLLDDQPSAVNDLLQVALRFAARSASQWSKREAFAVARSLEGRKQIEIADGWIGGPTSPQNAANALRRAAWAELEALLICFAQLIKERLECASP